MMRYLPNEIKVIRSIIPDVDKKDHYPFSTVRGLLDIFHDNRQSEEKIWINVVLNSPSFIKFDEYFKEEIINTLSDLKEYETEKESSIEFESAEYLDKIFDELVERTRESWKAQSYPIKLKLAWWLSEYVLSWNFHDLWDYIIQTCSYISETIDTRLNKYHTNEMINKNINLDSLTTFQIEFHLSTNWRIVLWIDELSLLSNNSSYSKELLLSQNFSDIITLIRSIWYFEDDFNIWKNIIKRNAIKDDENISDIN